MGDFAQRRTLIISELQLKISIVKIKYSSKPNRESGPGLSNISDVRVI